MTQNGNIVENPVNSIEALNNVKQDKAFRPMGIAYIIGRLERGLYRQIRTAISFLGVTVSQYTALSVFNARGNMSNAQLAERTMVSPQAANELIKTMEAEGWIKREPDKTHKRIIQISLTESGKKLLIQCDEIISVMEDNILRELNEDERSLLKSQLRGMLRLLMEP
jgi:DNA-binding MarR family transcriptional regulator